MLLILRTTVCYSPHVSEKMIVCYSNIATSMVESLPGFGERGRGQWLIHEQESAFVNHSDYLLGWGVLSMCKILLVRWGKQWPGETIHYF